MMRLAALVVALIAGVASAPPQERRLARPADGGQRRLALVIGNDRYAGVPLVNAVNDARAVSAALTRLGFTVDTAENASAEALARAVDRFVGRIQAGDAALFYYSGHGVQVDGLNYLIPVDFQGSDPVSLKFRALSVSELDERLERRGARVRLLVLDACRDNPFRATRSVGGGLASYTAEGALIAFATAAGNTASDNAGAANGLFTTYFLEALQRPGLTVADIFRWVRLQVREKSGGRQVPWVHDGLIGDFVLNGGAPAPGERGNAARVEGPVAPPRPAAPPAARTREPKLTFSSPAGLLLVHVMPDRAPAFEQLAQTIERTVAMSSSLALRRQSDGLRFYKAAEPFGSSVLYVMTADPAVPGGEYDFLRVFTDASGGDWDGIPATTQDVIRKGLASATLLNRVSLTPLTRAFDPPGRRSALPASAPAVPPRLTFTAPAGLLLAQIKSDQVAVFEDFVAALDARLAVTADPVLGRQAAGFRIYKATEPYQGNALYVVQLTDAVANADYDLFSMMNRAMTPDEQRAAATQGTWNRWAAAFATGMNRLNLTRLRAGDSTAPPPIVNPLRVGGQIREPAKLKHVEPVYPEIAVSARVQGVVILEATIDARGRVVDISVLRSHPLLDPAAIDAVRQWEYAPTYLDGVAVPVIMSVTVTFSLR